MEKQAMKDEPVVKEKAPKRSQKSILVVEDDPDISKALGFQMRRKGFRVLVAEDGETGLKMAVENIPAVVILDLYLPRISGEEVCKAIREHDDARIQKIPIIMLTAKNMIADRIIGKVIGANCYMTKPFSMESLLEEINRLAPQE